MSNWTLKKVEKETEPKCWHCNTNIVYACWIENTETKEALCVGRSCCSNFLAKSTMSQVSCAIDHLKTKDICDNTLSEKNIVFNDITDKQRKNVADWLAVKGGWHFVAKFYPEYYTASVN